MIPVIFGIGAAMTATVGANNWRGENRPFAEKGLDRLVRSIGLLLAVFPDLWLGRFLEPSDTAAREAGRSGFGLVADPHDIHRPGVEGVFAAIRLWREQGRDTGFGDATDPEFVAECSAARRRKIARRYRSSAPKNGRHPERRAGKA